MDSNDIKCRKCGAGLFEASNRGAYLTRVNKKGEDFIGECRPSCESTGNKDDALLRAVNGEQDG